MEKRDERYLPEMPLDVDDLGLRPRLDMLLTEDGSFLNNIERLPTPLHDANSLALNAMAMSRESCLRRVQTCPTDLSSLFQQNTSPATVQPVQGLRRQLSQTYLPPFGQFEQQQHQQLQQQQQQQLQQQQQRQQLQQQQHQHQQLQQLQQQQQQKSHQHQQQPPSSLAQSAGTDYRFSQPPTIDPNSIPLVDLFAAPTLRESHHVPVSLEHMQSLGHIQSAPVMALPVIGPGTFHHPNREFVGLRRIQTAPVPLASMAMPDNDQKLAKKAEAARQSRRRKKEQIQQLEAQVTKLSSRLAELQATYNPDQLQASHAYDQGVIKTRMHELLQHNPIPTDELHQLIEEFIRNSRNRQNSADCYLARASRNLAPTTQDRFLHWALNIVSPQSSLYDPIADAVKAGISPSQLQQLQTFQVPFQDLSWSLGQIEERLRRLSKRIRKHLSAQHEHIDRLRAILTVEQVAKFCLWVDSNPVCGQMLSRVWSN